MPWNPIGTGDRYGNPSEVLAHSNDGTTIYVKSRPKQWALNNVPCECIFEHWVRLNANAVEVENRLTNARSDTTQYPAFDQELPAIYTIGKLHRLVTYSGTNPYSGDAVTQLEPLLEGSFFHATEKWAALVNDAGWGLGVYSPEIQRFYGKFFGQRGVGSSAGFSTGYMAVNTQEILDHNIVFDYGYSLVLGTVADVRAYAVARQPAEEGFLFDFDGDRDHWAYVNASDAGPPKSGLTVDLAREDPQLWGPLTLWTPSGVPTIYIRAAYRNAPGSTGRLYWARSGESFSSDRSVDFQVISDTRFHTYELHLTSAVGYTGEQARFRFDPIQSGQPDASIQIAYISSEILGT
jgi:hypothetical protein